MTISRFSLSLLCKYKYTEPRAPQIHNSIYLTSKADQPHDNLLAVLVADRFNSAIRHSGSHASLNAESLNSCAEGSFQRKSFTNIWVWFFLWHQCYCALLLWVPLLQEIGGISRLRFRDRQGQETLGCEVVLSVLAFSNLGTTKKWQMAVWWSVRLQEKAGKR